MTSNEKDDIIITVEAGDELTVTDKQYQDLLRRFEELSQKYAQMSRDIASIKMRMDMKVPIAPLPEQRSKRDITKYSFMGRQYGKRQLVLVCIKQYVADSQISSAKEMFDIFPDYVQGSLGVIRAASEAEQYQDATAHYYFSDEDVLNFDEGTYVVCKDWTVDNISRFVDIMETLGYEIKSLTRN